MNDILDPPAERDMPPGRSSRMRADLMAAINRPEHGRNSRRRLVLVAALIAAVAGGAATAVVGRDGGPAQVLVGYDADGNEVARARLFPPTARSGSGGPDQYDRCYVDPSGNVVHGDPGPNCLPAHPWTH